MVDDKIASTDTLDRTATRKLEDHGYVVVRGLLDDAEDIRPVRDEYERLLDSLVTIWHKNGELSSTYDDLPFEQRLAVVASEGVPYTDYFDICFTGKEGLMHRGPAVFNLLRSPRLLDGVEHFIGPEVYSNPIQHVRIKVPERLVPTENQNDMNSRTPWHQDASTVTSDAKETQNVDRLACDNGVYGGERLPGSRPGEPQRRRVVGALQDRRGPPYRHPRSVPRSLSTTGADETWRCPVHDEHDQARFTDERKRRHPIQLRPPLPSDGSADRTYLVSGFVARSRARPESELRDFDTWDRLWDEARLALEAIDYNTPGTTHWKTGEQDPRCA